MRVSRSTVLAAMGACLVAATAFAQPRAFTLDDIQDAANALDTLDLNGGTFTGSTRDIFDTLATLAGAVRRKGFLGGALDTALNFVPYVGGAKNLAEARRGRDFIPDRPARSR